MKKFTQEEINSIPGEPLRIDSIEVQLVNGKGIVLYPELTKDMMIFSHNWVGSKKCYVVSYPVYGKGFELQSWLIDIDNPKNNKIDSEDNSLQVVSIIFTRM